MEGTENPMAQTESNCNEPQLSRMKLQLAEARRTRA
jgi:hypothetical protein